MSYKSLSTYRKRCWDTASLLIKEGFKVRKRVLKLALKHYDRVSKTVGYELMSGAS